MGYIPQASLENLKKYSYKGLDKSLLSKYVLNPFWTWFVTLWPLSIAPNTITLTGLMIVIINFATMLYYDPVYLTEKGGAVGPPQWLFFTWAVGLFLYQSLDAIDGKQARRTGMAGPLGEMFDHGCDALNTTLECLLTSYALNLGRSWWTIAAQIATLANFYLTTWEEYHTGILYLGVFSGPVEGIIMIVIIYICTGLFGPSFWDQRILTIAKLEHDPRFKNIPNVGLNEALMVFAGFGLALNIMNSYHNVRQASKRSGKSPLQALLLLLPFVVSAAIQVLWLSHPEFNHSAIINSATFVPFVGAWGLQFAHQVGRMILAHVTSTPFPRWDWIWIWSVLGAVDANLPHILGCPPIIQTSHKNTTIFVWLTLVVSFVTYARFCYLVINDITNYLGIACFTVRKRDEKGVWRHKDVPNGKQS
ncbi:Choline/ethanolaminephosphotransferase [Pluteus cervinus]|uniref:Choline/ethanolaminephosphotransferase n=1 Tax=Pluteus cervinus TaxID=181527 RepID=A0ACD3AWX7_9AGAR|nr:Choline/ethanolaminephosphotransferase [Pluteus cervinus]